VWGWREEQLVILEERAAGIVRKAPKKQMKWQ
jgi:hypothetical protein